MKPDRPHARTQLKLAFSRRREALHALAQALRQALDGMDNPTIRLAFHDLSAAIEGRIVWEQGALLPLLAADDHAADSGCVAHVENDHLLLLRLLDAFGDWLVAQPLRLDPSARDEGVRHFERLNSVLAFHERREADFTYPAAASLLAAGDCLRLAQAMEHGAPCHRGIADAA